MKLTVILLTAGFLHVYGAGMAQNVTLSGKDISLKQVFTAIEKQTGYVVFYNREMLSNTKPVSLTARNMPLIDLLHVVLKDQPVDFIIQGKTIILSEKPFAPPAGLPVKTPLANAVNKPALPPVTGRIVDAEGRPLPGVSIVVKGTNKGGTSAADGSFAIAVNEGDVLVISSIGFAPLTIRYAGGAFHAMRANTGSKVLSTVPASLVIQLTASLSPLNEVQVIGYGTTTQRENTGAVSSITAREISKQTIDNPLTALQGRIAGMQITQDNGLPGGAVRVNIRGAGNGVSSAGFIPLYIVDGVPFTLFNGGVPATDNLNAYGLSAANGSLSPFSIIAPEDIERIDVLKDADATAIYGSRGSNGVVLITTKKGRLSRTAINVNAYTGTARVGHYMPMMNTAAYLQMRKDAFNHAGVTPTSANAPDLTVWDQQAYTDWQRWAIGGTAHTTNVNASVSGGNAQNTFLLTTTYRKQGTVYQGDFGANTFSGRLNAGHRSANNKLSIDVTANYSYMGTTMPNTDLSTIYNLAPNYPIFNSDGSWNWAATNPLSYLKKTTKSQTTNLISNLNIAYKVLPELTLKANLGYTLTRLKQQQVNPASAQNPAGSVNSSLRYADNDNNNYIIEPQAEYVKNISKGSLRVLAGATFQQTKANGISLTGTGYTNEALIYSLLAASTVTTSYNNNSTYRYNALFGRANYNWDGKYIVDGTFRRDGSSRFGANNKFGNFWAIGASWIFTGEEFMQQAPFLSFGKLRASYGVTGNDQIPDYQYFSLYGVAGSSSSYSGTTVLYPSNIANPTLHWESTSKLDVALELGFLEDRILLKTDYYRNRTSDPLNYVTVPSQSGTTSYLGNFDAVVQNRGWEFELNTTNINGKHFRWTTNLNLTMNRNKLLSFKDLATSSYSNSYILGQPTDIVKLYHYTGPDAQTGLPTFADQNKDGNILYSDDRYVANYGHPYYGGINNSFTYKGFQLDVAFQFNHRYDYKNATLAFNYDPYGYTYANHSEAVADRWTAPGSSGYYPAASVTGNAMYSTLASSDYNWGNISYIKLKTVSLNYSLPKQWCRPIRLSAVRVYVQGQNLYTWAKQKYTYDPETSVPGTGSGLGTGRFLAMPQLRTIVFGLNCSL
ncbi:MAG TPA: SusC/RagA family TonB-linked outer membrane protein [Chitinophaga sp.]|uniref:SusC/RagA family TonB-linked outer membrane protein n=1 Tax=Chitinophaga sp. TaxID=1869181 RepID=UPI002DBA96F4|nr:SusC/RagA family TonB-linked outer membrane protein [Chitinophaga sp.]HEU4551290.1 SusC/RagA family TonB-linked outer membrane protein [Chitinophaga sp.]